MKAYLQVKGISKSFKKILALNNINLEFARGKLSALLGPDGAGKSTLLHILSGVLDPDEGEVSLGEVNVLQTPELIKKNIGLMAQGLGHTLSPDLSIEENIHYFANIRNVDRKKRDLLKEKLLSATHLTPFRNRSAKKLSGGMKQKLALCCTLIHSPEVLFLDEPTTGVDPVSRRDFYKILQDAIYASGVTVVVTTSYMEEAERCDYVALMHEGGIIAKGTPEELKARINEKLLLLETDQPEKAISLLKSNDLCTDFSQRGHRITIAVPGDPADCVETFKKNGFPQLLKIQPDMEYVFLRSIKEKQKVEQTSNQISSLISKLKRQDNHFVKAAPVVVETKDLSIRFGSFTAVNNVSFSINKGEVFGFLGPNGAGKTTLIKMLCGLLKPSSGEGVIIGNQLGKERTTLAQKIGYMSQKFSLYSDLKVKENIQLFAGIYGLSSSEFKEKLPLALKLADLEGRENEKTKDLPLGIKQRLALSCALLHQPQLLFLDEPTSGVDPMVRDRFWRIIFELSRQLGVTIIVTTHYMDEAERCDRLMMMLEGKIVALGSPASLRAEVEKVKGKPLIVNTSQAASFARQLDEDKVSFSRYGNDVILYPEKTKDLQVIKADIRNNFPDCRISPGEIPFEDIFIHYVEEGI